ncbi:neutral/alkaline non-lysosomal ceramidase N-terminal domain-containing protein [Sphingomonas sp. HF-S3]|uniref:Neutral/alkaline non-lysosomal ceramidase N-terminal domain-containing protein n=1 Tax=Sphingomonas rustica TaxID=3103142 RepID=A0ABV0B8Y2_9SPHN
MASSRIVMTAALALSSLVPAAHAQGDRVTAGAAKVDITPAASSLGPGDVLRDRLFVRAIVIASGTSCAVLVGVDAVGIGDEIAQGAIRRASKATGCDAGNFVVSATHTHSSSAGPMRSSRPDAALLTESIVKAVTDARAALRPARIGYGTTRIDLNVNRDLFEKGRWVQGPNPAGVSDKTLSVLEILGADDLPIGVYLNYAMHPIHFNMAGVVSGDFAGEASRYIERRYGPATVAIFAQGASGDQNPRLMRPMNKLSRTRTGSPDADDMRLTAPRPWQPGAEGADVMRRRFAALGAPVPADRNTAYRTAVDEVGELVSATGTILGETAIDLMRYRISSRRDRAVIRGASTLVRCPGRDRQDRDDPVREGALPPYADGAPVEIRVGMLRIGDVYISTVNGEVYSEIALRLKREAPVANLMMTSLANGWSNSGYIYSNAASPYLTFQVIGSRLKPGCAEDGIVEASLTMIAAAGT